MKSLVAMKKLAAVAATFWLVACAENVSGGGSGGGGAGGASTAPCLKGEGGAAPAPAVSCTECIAQPVSWGSAGGLVYTHDESALTSCRTYEFTRQLANAEPPPPETCTLELGGCDAELLSIRDIEQALAHPDVVAALAGSTRTFGMDQTAIDLSLFRLTVGSVTVSIGTECDEYGCASPSCVPIPPGLRALRDLLVAVRQEALGVGECAEKFP